MTAFLEVFTTTYLTWTFIIPAFILVAMVISGFLKSLFDGSGNVGGLLMVFVLLVVVFAKGFDVCYDAPYFENNMKKYKSILMHDTNKLKSLEY